MLRPLTTVVTCTVGAAAARGAGDTPATRARAVATTATGVRARERRGTGYLRGPDGARSVGRRRVCRRAYAALHPAATRGPGAPGALGCRERLSGRGTP